MNEVTKLQEWKEILFQVEISLDRMKDQVLTASAREDLGRVRYLAGQYAGAKAVLDYLRSV